MSYVQLHERLTFQRMMVFNQPVGGWDTSAFTNINYMCNGDGDSNHPFGA